MSESISITNGTGSALDFHFYQYSDFQLAGIASGERVQLGKNLRGLYNEAKISRNDSASSVQETVVTPGANEGEAAFYNSTLAKLSDGNTDTLNNNNDTINFGNATWAFEWDLTIAPQSSVAISKDKLLHWDPVPEPSFGVLTGLALAMVAVLRRRK